MTAAAAARALVWCGLSHIVVDTHTHTDTEACMPDTPPTALSLFGTYKHTLGGRGSVQVADPVAWSVLKRGEKSSRAADSTMPVQRERLKCCLSLCLWSQSPLLLLGLFCLHAQAHGKLL